MQFGRGAVKCRARTPGARSFTPPRIQSIGGSLFCSGRTPYSPEAAFLLLNSGSAFSEAHLANSYASKAQVSTTSTIWSTGTVVGDGGESGGVLLVDNCGGEPRVIPDNRRRQTWGSPMLSTPPGVVTRPRSPPAVSLRTRLTTRA